MSIFGFNSITATVETAHGGFLNFSQNYFPGWRAYINGESADVEFVNALIMGVYVYPGTHDIKFTFMSTALVNGAIITGIGIVACVAIFAIAPYIKRRRHLTIPS